MTWNILTVGLDKHSNNADTIELQEHVLEYVRMSIWTEAVWPSATCTNDVPEDLKPKVFIPI